MKARYKHLSLPEELVKKIDKYLERDNKLAFNSRADAVKYCLRRFLDIKL